MRLTPSSTTQWSPIISVYNGLSAGLDFGTTNSVIALTGVDETLPKLVELESAAGISEVFRSALCFWQDEDVRGGLAVEAGPAAIHEYLEDPGNSRFLQSFKSVAASPSFESASVFTKRYRFEELGRLFIDKIASHAGGALDGLGRLVVGRPVHYAGGRPDPVLARQRYDAMFAGFAGEIHYVYEPLAAAFSYASRLDQSATLLVADFGGGTSDFSIVEVKEPGAARRCVPLSHAGVGIAGDRFDQRIVDKLVLPKLGKGGQYRSFGKVLDIPATYFNDFADWSKLALMRNRRTMAELEKLQRNDVDPDAIGRMIAMIEHELGFALYDAVGKLKRALSSEEIARFHFDSPEIEIDVDVARSDFEGWIAEDVARMAAAVDEALTAAGINETQVDRVFLTGGTSLVPAVRSVFTNRFGHDKIMSGGELTSIAHGLALVAQEDDLSAWVA